MADQAEEMGAENLLERVASISRELGELETLDEVLQRIADLGEAYLTKCDGVSLMLIGSKRQVSSPAYSSKAAYESDLAQYEADEGPCLEAIREHTTVIIEDLETEERWPRYRELALKLGVRSMVSFRLFSHRDTMGALNFYSQTPNAFDRYSRIIGQVFASHAAVALKSAITEAGLERALETRDVIGQAKGIIMAHEKVTPAAAFARLVEVSQRENRALRDLARQIAESGETPKG